MKTIRMAFLIIGMSLFLCLEGCSKQEVTESGNAGKQSGTESGNASGNGAKQAGTESGNAGKQSGNAGGNGAKQAGTESGNSGDSAAMQSGNVDASEDGSPLQPIGLSDEVLTPDSEKVWLCTRIAYFYPENPAEDGISRLFYNDKGYLIKEEGYTQAQELGSVANYGGFLEDGNPSWMEREYYENQKVSGTIRTNYVYEDGKLKELSSETKKTDGSIYQKSMEKIDEYGNPYWYEIDSEGLHFVFDYRLEYEYDEEERPIKICNYNKNDQLEGVLEYEYDKKGNVTKESVRSVTAGILHTYKYFYDENGNNSRMECYDGNGELFQKVVYKYEQFVIKK
ncbi:MAG: hypothetical protein IK081_06385 [Lachnospiraceae bacterium]|nr:hypothetical protein [Lachnospiraceae bacterium]